MLFNSYEFLFRFLPLVLVLYYILRLTKRQSVINWFLILTSLIFYGNDNSKNVFLIIASISINYLFSKSFAGKTQLFKRFLFITAISLNLLVLIYYKYASFIIEQFVYVGLINSAADYGFSSNKSLPLAISFFTFQQIAFIVYQYRQSHIVNSFTTYATSVVFFPHLIAGPLVEYKTLIPQFASIRKFFMLRHYFYLGIFVFIIGLSKKLLLADSLDNLVQGLFSKSSLDILSMSVIEVAIGVIAYSLQLYFDFSGYTDMAIGLAFFFGIKLPDNFNSPYKSSSLIEFWRRWHISLSNFLRDYLYISLGGSRFGKIRKYINLLITMLLGGVWHGAGWNFLIWGAWHGFGLSVNHIFKDTVFPRLNVNANFIKIFSKYMGVILTYIFVCIGWIFFKSTSFSQAKSILHTLFFNKNYNLNFKSMGEYFMQNSISLMLVIFIFTLATAMPNSIQLRSYIKKNIILSIKYNTKSLFRLYLCSAILALLLVLCLARMAVPQAFIYYQF